MAEPTTAKPRRRWYQFRLRTLLIGMALLAIPCGYVAHEANIVRERKAVLALVAHRGGYYEASDEWCGAVTPKDAQQAQLVQDFPGRWHVELTRVGNDEMNPSTIRRWLGDEIVHHLVYPISIDPAEAELIERSFPEAFLFQEYTGSPRGDGC